MRLRRPRSSPAFKTQVRSMCGKPAPIRAARQFVHTAQGALLVDLAFIAIALCCAFALPRGLGDDRATENV